MLEPLPYLVTIGIMIVETAQRHEHSCKDGNITANVGSRFRKISVTVSVRLLPLLLFSLKYMICQALKHETSD